MPVPNKVRGVFERPTGSDIWWIQYFSQGKRRRERVGRRGDAIKLYQKRKTQILIGQKLPELQRKRVTLGDLIDRAIDFARENHASPRDAESKGQLLREAFAKRAAEEVTPDELMTWLRKRQVSAATFNRYRSFLSLCYREGMRSGQVTGNPAKLIAMKREPRGRERYLSRAEYDTALALLQKTWPQYVALFIVSVHTGMRLGEQDRLRWKDIDFDRNEIRIGKSKNGDPRTIPMTSVVALELRNHRPADAKGADRVFPRQRQGKTTREMRWFLSVMQADGLSVDDYTWHNNRHTFCSWLAIAGVPLRTIQALAGHRTIAMTARYAHLSPDHTAAEIEKLVAPATPKLITFPSATKTATS